MSFAEQRDDLSDQLQRLEDLLRQAQAACKALEEHAERLTGLTDSLADDMALARITGATRKSRQDLVALVRAVSAARDGLSG
jgi:hypothetical protein